MWRLVFESAVTSVRFLLFGKTGRRQEVKEEEEEDEEETPEQQQQQQKLFFQNQKHTSFKVSSRETFANAPGDILVPHITAFG